MLDTLDIPVDSLRMLSCFLGNYHICNDKLKPFYKKFGQGSPGAHLVEPIAALIRKKWKGREHIPLDEQVSFIYEETNIDMGLIRTSLEFYSLDKVPICRPSFFVCEIENVWCGVMTVCSVCGCTEGVCVCAGAGGG